MADDRCTHPLGRLTLRFSGSLRGITRGGTCRCGAWVSLDRPTYDAEFARRVEASTSRG